MIKDLVSLANHLDAKGLVKEADYLDKIIQKAGSDFEQDEPKTISEWEEMNPEPEWDEEVWDNEGDAFEMDDGYRMRAREWQMRKDRFEMSLNTKHIEDLKQRMLQASTPGEVDDIAEEIKRLMSKGDWLRTQHERTKMDNYIDWYDNQSPAVQREHDRANAMQDRYDMFRREF